MMMVSLVWARDPPLTKASPPHPRPSAKVIRSFRIIFSLLPQDLLLRLRGRSQAALSASLSLIDFPNPSYLSPSFEVRRVEVYVHLNGLVERRRVEPLQIVEEDRERVYRPRRVC